MAFSGTSVRRAGGNPRRCHRFAPKKLSYRPAGSRPPVTFSQHRWLDQVQDWIALTGPRADAARNVYALAMVLAAHANYRTGLTRPTWDRLRARTSLSRSTVANWLAELQKAGLVELVERGTTPQFSPAILTGPNDRNRAAVYRLVIIPEPDDPHLSRTPTGSGFDLVSSIPAPAQPRADQDHRAQDHRAGGRRGSSQPRPECRGGGKRAEEKRAARSADHPPSPRRSVQAPRRALGRYSRIQHAERLPAAVPALRGLSAAHIASVIRPYLDAGWTDLSLIHAIDHDPDGTQHWQTAPVRSPAGWLAWRLGRWRRADGTLWPSNRQRMLAAAGYGARA